MEIPIFGADPNEINVADPSLLRIPDRLGEYRDTVGNIVVIKVGTRTLINPNGTVRRQFMRSVAYSIDRLRQHGISSALVTSGARKYGEFKLRGLIDPNSEERLSDPLHSAVGQARLMRVWEEEFHRLPIRLPVAQFLLAEGDSTDYVPTMQEFMDVGVPIINWNDAAFGIIGQNDTLTEKVALDLGANSVFFFTNKPGVLGPDGNRIPHLALDDSFAHLIQDDVSDGGTGGMKPKLDVAYNLASNGIRVFILDMNYPEDILAVAEGEDVGTRITLA